MSLEDIQAVRTLSMQAGENFDKYREFSSLSTLKIKKKDRHNRTLYDFSKFLEETNEAVVQEVLLLSRGFRETMETTDDQLNKFCMEINEESFLIPRSERDLLDLREELINRINERSRLVESFASALDNTETKRAEVTGAELKRLVDKLIAIAHLLPDDIEHIVEAEAFELNTEIITNKNIHSSTVAEHQIRQVKLEVELLQRWEDTRVKWRNLRHENSLNEFREHIASDEFNDPSDRQQHMQQYRAGQDQRQQQLLSLLARLGALHSSSISAEEVAAVQAQFIELNEEELQIIQRCYNRLGELRSGLAYFAQDRVESLRRELHVFGALKVEPDREAAAAALQAALDDVTLSELWRLGGGLKSEFQSQITDLRGEEVIYERVVLVMEERLLLILSSFNLKQVLEQRGRLAQLEKTRALITKMRTAPRSEVADVLRSLLPDLQSAEEIEQLPELFRSTVSDIANEIVEELESVDRRLAAASAGSITSGTSNFLSDSRSQSAKTFASGASGKMSASTLKTARSNKTFAASATGGSNSSSRGGSSGNSAVAVAVYADPNLVKVWNRRLGILYFGSDLSEHHQIACSSTLQLVQQQRECNKLVDAAVAAESDDALRRIDRRYEKSNEAIATFLETQASQLAQCTANIGDFFLRVAKLAEAHRAEQKRLDEKSADEIWDLKEEFRLACEDRETLYESACQRIRESTQQQQLEAHFEEVLEVLEQIQQSYRDYHSDACFAADRYPLMLLHDFRLHLDRVCSEFFLLPQQQHPLIVEYGRVFDQTIRFNRKYFDGGNETAAGMTRIAPPAAPAAPLLHVPSNHNNNNNSSSNGSADKLQSEVTASTTGHDLSAAAATAAAADSAVDATAPVALLSPFIRNGETAPPDANCGTFFWIYSESAVERRFRDEAAFAAPETATAAAATATTEEPQSASSDELATAATATATAAVDNDNTAASLSRSALLKQKEAHAEFPYWCSDCPVLPAPASAVAAMHPDDRDDYHRHLLKHFIALECDINNATTATTTAAATSATTKTAAAAATNATTKTTAAATNAAAAVAEVPSMLAEMSEEQLQLYRETRALHAQLLQQQLEESTPEFICAHPPLDPRGSNWTLAIDVSPQRVLSLFGGIRDSIIANLEQQSLKRTVAAERVSDSTKKELTDELEDRIRNHWPRRGCVETQIKQPREAELLGHKEKTWRHISSIQQKMIQQQQRVDEQHAVAAADCDVYQREMNALITSLDADFNNLAALQGIDVKTRGVTQNFQSQCAQVLSQLQQLLYSDVDAIVAFARDFRKICPPQSPGVQGGYSESELSEIEALVEAQCTEIAAVAEEWAAAVAQLEQQQLQQLQLQSRFSEKYKQRSQDVAMAEGLGQKYGAPRRRAQERIRTEISRDEARAGRIDSLLARLEFECSEALLRQRSSNVDNSDSHSTVPPPQQQQTATTAVVTFSTAENGFTASEEKLFQANVDWNLLVQVRLALSQRVQYLCVGEGPPLELLPLQWLPDERLARCAAVGIDNGTASLQQQQQQQQQQPSEGLEALFEDVDKVCRLETQQLYAAEGLQDALSGDGGVPESLQQWLAESREKVLGKGGYRERAWKRLWVQTQRSEDVLARHLVPSQSVDAPINTAAAVAATIATTAVATATTTGLTTATIAAADMEVIEDGKSAAKYSTKLGIPAICLRLLTDSCIDFALRDKRTRVAEFSKLLRLWEKAREKHERLLRPRLGSPDMADELQQLDAAEMQRSAEVCSSIHTFRTQCVRSLRQLLLQFVEDTCSCAQGLMTLLDSTVRQELLQVPPDTDIPKKHMSLKKLRKAQRVRGQVANGGEDRSKQRVWAGVDAQFPAAVLRAAEDLVRDLGSDAEDTAPDPRIAAAATAAAMEKGKGGKTAAKKLDKNAAAVSAEEVLPSLVPAAWEQRMQEQSALIGQVSTAHRIVISERDGAVHRFSQHVAACFEELRADFDMLLRQERSWIERWSRQVALLRRGSV